MAARKARTKRAKTGSKARAKTARRPAAKRAARKPKAAASGMKRKIQHGVVTHTELASADPQATQTWLERVLGWKFMQAMPTPTGPYRMWQFKNGTGGGLRSNQAPEGPGSIPYCEVNDIRGTYAKALDHGATAMMPPEEIPGGMGWIAIVAAPGGVPIGFWGQK